MTQTDQTNFGGHPKGLLVLSGVEMWERFSFHTMRAMLVLFLTAPVAASGFGWTSADAFKLYGAYVGMIYFLPLFGGMLADRVLGMSRAIIIGSLIMCAGHFLMTGPAIIPLIADQWTSGHASTILSSEGLVLGQFSHASLSQVLTPALAAQLESEGLNPDDVFSTLYVAYSAITFSFFGALALIVAGAGIFLPAASGMLGALYTGREEKRDSGFLYFYLAINVGATLAPIAGGIFGEQIGWHVGFFVAGLAMVAGLLVFVTFKNRYLRDVGNAPTLESVEKTSEARDDAALEKAGNRPLAIVLLSSFLIVSEVCIGQGGGLLSVFVRDRVDRTIFGSEIPAVAFQSLFPFFIMVFAVILAVLIPRLSRQGRNPPIAVKFALGFVALCMMLLTLLFASSGTGLVNPSILIVVFGFMALTEVLIYPIARSMVTRYAPQDRSVTFMGVLFLCIAVGSLLSGYVGAWSESIGDEGVFWFLFWLSIAAALVLLVFRKQLTRLSGGLEPEWNRRPDE